jgi:hypothetical protein
MSEDKSGMQNDKTTNLDDSDSKLRQLVRKYRVYWLVMPAIHINESGSKVQIGYNLALVGTNSKSDKTTLVPGSKESADVFVNLRQIAEGIMPGEDTGVRCHIRDLDNVLFHNLKDQEKNRKSMAIVLQIRHREKFDRPVDNFLMGALKELEERLKNIGANKELWKASSEELSY